MDTKIKELKPRIYFYRHFFFLGLLGIYFNAGAQGEPEVTPDKLPLDQSIRYGRFPNGFTYFIKSVPNPQSKLYLRLYNKAGYNQQDSDQLNMAHAVEHLAYKTTQNFPEGLAQSRKLNKLGLGMFDYISASSGNKITQFHFNAPSHNLEALEVGFLFFKDVSQGLKLTEKDINSVRGELRQEFLEGGEDINFIIDTKLRSKIFPCRQDYSGFLEYHKSFSPEVVRRFYKDWYRPNLMALSAVGNIKNIDSLERLIRVTFSDIQPAENQRKVKNCDSLYHTRPYQFFIEERPTDHSQLVLDSTVNLQLVFRDPATNKRLNTLRGIKRLNQMKLLMDIVNKRLKESTKGYNSLNAGVRDTYQYEELPVTLMVKANFENMDVKDAVQEIILVIYQLQKYGVTKKEWMEIKKKQLNILSSTNLQDPYYWLKEIENYFSNAEALPANKNKHLVEGLSDLSRVEFNEFTGQFLSKEPEDIGIIAPSGHKALSLKETEVRKWIMEVYKNPVKPFEPAPVPLALMSVYDVANLRKVEIKKMETGKSGAKEFLLDNGLKLVIKPLEATSGPHKNKIKVHGFALKGANCFSKEDFFSIINAPSIVNNSGINGMTKFQLNDFLSNKDMLPGVVSSYIDLDESGIQGAATFKNFENLLQLIYLQITRQNKDEIAFEDWKYKQSKAFKNFPGSYFYNTIKKVTGDSSVVDEVLGSKHLQSDTQLFFGLEQIDLDVAYDHYQKLFGNAKDFTFIVTGDFEEDSILPLLVKYLGNLPGSSSLKNCTPAPKIKKELRSGPSLQVIPAPGESDIQNIKYGVQFLKGAVNPFDWQEQIKVEALGEISTHKAWALRFEKGYSLYSVGVNGKYNKDLKRYEVSSFIECMPEEFPMIRKELLQIFSNLKLGKISEGFFQKGMDRMYILYDSEKRAVKHMDLHQDLYEHYRYDQPCVDPVEVERFVKSLTIKDMIETAEEYYDEGNLYEFLMFDREKD